MMEELKCPKCESGTLRREFDHFSGPFRGILRCDSCDFSEGVMSFLGKSLFPVQTLPVPEVLYYLDEEE